MRDVTNIAQMRYNMKIQWMLLFALIMAGQVSFASLRSRKGNGKWDSVYPKGVQRYKVGI